MVSCRIYSYDLLHCPCSGILCLFPLTHIPFILYLSCVTLKLPLSSTLSLLSRLDIYVRPSTTTPHTHPNPPPASRTPPQADPHIQTTQQWLLSGGLIKAIVVMYVALSRGYCVPMDNVLPSSVPIVPFETELGKYPIYRPSNNGLMFPYKC